MLEQLLCNCVLSFTVICVFLLLQINFEVCVCVFLAFVENLSMSISYYTPKPKDKVYFE